MGKIPVTREKFTWQTPTQGVLYPVATMSVPANATWRIAEGFPLTVLIPVYEEVTADASTGEFSLTPKYFIPSNYWKPEQLIYVYDVTNSTTVSFTYDSATNTVSGTTGAGATVRVYYIPYHVELRVEAEFQTPSGRRVKSLFIGDTGQFVYTDLGRDKIRFEGGVDLHRSDKLYIKARSSDTSVKVDPLLPDGSLVPIVKANFYVEQISSSVV